MEGEFEVKFFAQNYNHQGFGASLLLLLFSLNYSSLTQARYKDRLIIEVNNTIYTQWQVEAFHFAHALMKPRLDRKNLKVNTQNWRQVLKKFELLIILLQEANRLGSFLPNKEILDEVNSYVTSRINNNLELQRRYQELGLNPSEMKKNIRSIIQVESLRESKSRRQSREKSVSKKDWSESAWFLEISNRTLIRRYRGAEIYQSLNASSF